MGQSYDRPGGGQGGFVLPKPTPPPARQQGGSVGTLRGGIQAPSPADYREEPTNLEPSASRLPAVKPPPRKIGSVPEMAVFSGISGAQQNGYDTNGHVPGARSSPPPARASLPAVSPPPRRSPSLPAPPPSLGDSITDIRSDLVPAAFSVPQAADTYREQHDLSAQPLDWSDEEESTSVYSTQSGPPPADDLSETLHRPGPQPSSARMAPNSRASSGSIRPGPPSQRAPRIVPPAPSRSTLLGVNPQEFRGSRPSQPAFPPPAPSLLQQPALQTQPQALLQQQAPQQQTFGLTPSAPPPPVAVYEQQAGQLMQAGPVLEFPTGLQQGQGSVGQQMVAAQAHPSTASPALLHGSTADSAFVRLPQGRAGQLTEVNPRRLSLSGAEPIPEPSNTGKMAVAIALVTALVTAAAAGTFFFLRRPGGLEIDVRDPKGTSISSLAVYVDGKKVCESSPCVVRDLDPGPKTVRVVAPGFADEEPQTTEVAAGGTNKMSLLLKPSFGTLLAASEQPSLRIFVDGTERGPLPARLADLTPGTHQIRIIGGDRYKALEKAVDIKVGEQVDFGGVKLDVIRGKMTVSLKTEGASILLIPNDDTSKAKSLDGPFPRAVEVETNSGSWKLVAKKKGFPDFVAPLDFSDGIAEKNLEVVLSKDEPKDEAKSTEAKSTDAAIAKNTPPTPPSQTGGTPTPPPAPPPDKPENKAPESGTGTLNINSIPPSRILLDGQPMGETPKTVQVSPGTHTVTFVHSELGKKSVSVSIKAGETKSAGAKLRSD